MVYLTAILLLDGEASGAGGAPSPYRVLSEDGRSTSFRPEGLKERYYGDCSDADIAWAAALLVPQATIIG